MNRIFSNGVDRAADYYHDKVGERLQTAYVARETRYAARVRGLRLTAFWLAVIGVGVAAVWIASGVR